MTRLERTKLYNEVWSRPCTKVAEELRISSSALKRICLEMDIPTPVAGYWTRVQCGKKVSKEPLPKASKGTRLTWDVDLVGSKRQKSDRMRKEMEEREVTERVKENVLQEISVTEDLENLHPLVKATRVHLREAWSKKPWTERKKERKHFNAQVSESCLERALLFLDAFARGIESLGLRFRSDLDDSKERKQTSNYGYSRDERLSSVCWVEFENERISFGLKEKRKRIMITDPEEKKRLWGRSYEDVPSGLLEFSIGAGWGFDRTSTWKDGKIQRIENCLTHIVATVPLAGDFLQRERLRQEQQKRRWEQLDELRYRMDAIKREENDALEDLMKQSANYRLAQELRAFVDAARSLRVANGSNLPVESSPEDLWLRWAEQHASTLDPLAKKCQPWECRSFLLMSGLFPRP